MSYKYLLIDDAASARIITLNRPDKRNALSAGMLVELADALKSVAPLKDIRALIIAAAGPVFSSGHDLSELNRCSEPGCRELFGLCSDVMQRLHTLPQPVIAEVHGLATAAGCQLVAACDLAVAGEKAAFATPGVRIGLFCSTPMVPLVRAIGRKRAMEMLLTARTIDARTAEAWGLVNRVVPQSGLRSETLALAKALSEASASTVAAGKRTFYATVDRSESDAYIIASEAMTAAAMHPDAHEGVSAFLDKRVPRWPSSETVDH